MNTGIYIGFLVNAKQDFPAAQLSSPDLNTTSLYKRVDMGAVLGVGLKIPVKKFHPGGSAEQFRISEKL